MAKYSRKSNRPAELSQTSELWILRILVELGAHREFLNQHDFSIDMLAYALGLGHWISRPPDEFDRATVLAELRRRLARAERVVSAARLPSSLQRNVARLKELVGLTDADCGVLEFVVTIHNDRMLDAAADCLGSLSTLGVYHALAAALDIPEREIRDSLGPQGALVRSGLVALDRAHTGQLRMKLDLISHKFGDAIASVDADPVTLLRDIVAPAGPAHLTLADYEHVATSLEVLRPHLKRSIAAAKRGVNVYLHGASGTGKSQLVKLLAQELGCELFEVASEDSDGDPVSGDRRLRALRAAQSFFSQRKALIVFDEVEDVFSDGDFGRKSVAQTRKAWLNRMLEDNPVPALWLSNSIEGIDPAFIRRFDMVFEMPVPPKAQRRRILDAACGDLIPAEQLARIAESDALAPAVVTRAAAVMRTIRDDVESTRMEVVFGNLIDWTLKAQGHRTLRRADANRLPGLYDPAFIAADADLPEIASGLVESRAGRLCLYGPPGTGKSAFARWLADTLQVPLLVKQGSELMSKWLGESEKNIAAAFAQADAEKALLLIDEVDGFLMDRRGAARSWEVTLVNEMLTQMESFSGVFVASTNLMEGLDQAALRRFDLKVRFDYLKPAQSGVLLCRYCAEWGMTAPSPADLGRVERLLALTPGDFATVGRQHRFRRIRSAADFIAALEGECALKPGMKRAIGFY